MVEELARLLRIRNVTIKVRHRDEGQDEPFGADL
jgi:hypothetical protein